ncbi:endonuclease/exonuclease/phosphatase family protein [bacterium]|nr:endonuclease/exonuclease/phosphatase family protein [bacterium]
MNIAHGGKRGFNQVFLKTAEIKSNLREIANLLSRENPDIVALQEADGPSLWSGNFSHVKYLANRANYPYVLRGEHVKGLKLSYGTAFLSKIQISEPMSYTFKPSPPTFSKGFVTGTIHWPGKPERQIDVVSLHLDFSRKSIRKRQVYELISIFLKQKKPLIIMGDFNSGSGKKSPLRTLITELDLKVYKPKENKVATYPLTNKRIDWILISREMDFLNYRVLPDSVSDHKGVLVELIWLSE